MAKKRVTRKQLLKEPDEFITLTGKIIRWGRAHRTALIAGVSTALVALAGVNLYRYLDNRSELSASARLSEVTARYLEIESQKGSADALTESGPALSAIGEQYARNVGGRMAILAHANLSYRAGDTDNALKLYDRLEKSLPPNDYLLGLVTIGKAYCYAKKGDLQKAAEWFEKAAAGDDSGLAEDARFNLGILYARMGKADQSRAAFNQLIADHPDSIFKDIAKERIAG
jgi:tetratricopeptide (TPR) repeat protein